jgi:Tol biopolymer transport system component
MMAGACGSTTEPPPPPPRLNNEIVFTRRDSGASVRHLYRMNADGSSLRQVSRTQNGSVTSSSVSPDGQWIAYQSSGEIWKMRVDGSELQNLTRDGASDQSPAWSPDGTRIAFHSDRSAQQFMWDIFIMDADGSNATQITSDPAIEGNPSWAPDGSALAFWSWAGDVTDSFEVYIAPLDGQPPVNITNSSANDVQPAWSPDGTTLAFLSDRDWPNPILGLYLMNPDGSNVRLIPLAFVPGIPTWKPDGTRLLIEGQQIIGGMQGDFELWSVNPDGTDAVNLTNHPASDRFPTWSP